MIITYHGAQMIKIASGDFTLAVNPISKESKLKPVRFGADLALVSRNLPEFNGINEVSRKDKELFVIDGPGEYEVKSVFVKGVPSKSDYKHKDVNTIYTLSMDDMNIVFFGALSDSKPDMSFIEDIDGVDLLFVPIGDEGVLNHTEAYKLAVTLEPKIIIPVHFEQIGAKSSLENFKKEFGTNPDPQEKLTIKKKDLDDKNMELVILSTK